MVGRTEGEDRLPNLNIADLIRSQSNPNLGPQALLYPFDYAPTTTTATVWDATDALLGRLILPRSDRVPTVRRALQRYARRYR